MLDLKSLEKANRLLFSVPLRPVQGDRFQPTGFPSLGAASYQTKDGPKLLVESAQSMANRLEATCWDRTTNKPVAVLDGISHITINRKGAFMTDSMLESHRMNSPYILEGIPNQRIEQGPGESHRMNSPYILEGKEKKFMETLKGELGGLEEGPIDRKKLWDVLLKYDVGSLLHGVFLAKKELAGGRLRIARALSAFIEASGVKIAASGGVKNDHVNPQGDTKSGFGNVPFSRDEYVADKIECHINFDLAQIRGYGLEPKLQDLLILLALYRLRKLLNGDLRLRTACDLEPIDRDNIVALRPIGYKLPSLSDLEESLKTAIQNAKGRMVHSTVNFNDELKKGKEKEEGGSGDDSDNDDETEEG